MFPNGFARNGSFLLALFLATSTLLVTCNKQASNSTDLELPAIDVTGKWRLTIEGSDSIQQFPLDYYVDLDLTQAGATLSGSLQTCQGRGGSVAGTVTGDTIVDLEIGIDPDEDDLGSSRQTMRGTAQVSGETMELDLVLDLGGAHGGTSMTIAQGNATKTD